MSRVSLMERDQTFYPIQTLEPGEYFIVENALGYTDWVDNICLVLDKFDENSGGTSSIPGRDSAPLAFERRPNGFRRFWQQIRAGGEQPKVAGKHHIAEGSGEVRMKGEG